MSLSVSHYLANKTLDAIFRGQSFPTITTLYFALFTSATSDAGGGTEAAYSGYARVPVTSALTSFLGTHGSVSGVSSGTSKNISNAVNIQFPTPASGETVTHWAVLDAASGGNFLVHGQLTTPRAIALGQAGPIFTIGDFVAQM